MVVKARAPKQEQQTAEMAEQLLAQQEQMSQFALELKQKQDAEEKSLKEFSEVLQDIDPKGAPSLDQLKNWKSQYGAIYMSNVTDASEVFIWRTILRLEWKELLATVDMKNEHLRQEQVIKKYVLYPNSDKILYLLGAGYMTSIETAIMYQSGFVDEGTILSTIKIIE
jgi:hypothetical protein